MWKSRKKLEKSRRLDTLVYAKKKHSPWKKKHKKHSSPSKISSHRKKAQKSTMVLLKALAMIPDDCTYWFVLKYLILRYVQVIFTLFLKQILGIIIILITWSYVLQDIFVDLEMTGMDEVMFRPLHPLKFSPKGLCCWIFFWETQFCIRFQNI